MLGSKARPIQVAAKRGVKPLTLLGVEISHPFANLAGAEEGVQMHAPFPKQFHGRIELALVLFHDGETAPFEDRWESLRWHVEATEGDDLAQASYQVARQLFVSEEQDVGVIPMLPPLGNMLAPGAVADLAAHKALKELGERPFELQVHPVQVVVRNGHVLAVAGDIDVLAGAFRNLCIGQMALEDSRRRTHLEAM